ncbi:MAG: DUF115 domain-containing protein [Candidatus Hinthialibacter antarcticus]|nr:DUF115 domain-containing protein [Candidatus Hinthialibacter antarcticus]
MSGSQYFQKNLTVLRTINEAQAESVAAAATKLIERTYPCKRLEDGWVETYVPTQFDGSTQRVFTSGLPPKQEVEQWTASLEIEQNRDHAVILLGMGLGYHPMAVLQHLPQNGVLAMVEPDALLFLTAFVHVDLSRMLADRRLHLFVGQPLNKTIDSIGAELEWPRFLVLSHQVAATPLLARANPDYPARFAQAWRDALQRETMYRRSRVNHGVEVVKNTIANADALMRFPGVNHLWEQFNETPAVLAAPGPSLEQRIDALKAMQGRALITCVNSAYPILRKHGIAPHIVFTMDHNERNARSFDEAAPSDETVLVADPRIHSRIIRHFGANVMMASWRTTLETTGAPAPVGQIPTPDRSGNSISTWLQTLTGDKGDVFGSGSVTVAGFHILARMGCRPILLMGQDLAFSGDKAYADGTIFDDKSLPRDEQVSHHVTSVTGDKIATSDTLNLYRLLLEHEIKRFGVPVFNLSLGADITGAPPADPAKIGSAFAENETAAPQALRTLLSQYQPHTNRKVLREQMRSAVQELRGFAAQARAGINTIPPEESPSETSREKIARAQGLERLIQDCAKEHPLAMELLNELLQEAHFDHEENRWRLMVLPETQGAEESLRSAVRVLDAFVAQSDYLQTLLLQKIEFLER